MRACMARWGNDYDTRIACGVPHGFWMVRDARSARLSALSGAGGRERVDWLVTVEQRVGRG